MDTNCLLTLVCTVGRGSYIFEVCQVVLLLSIPKRNWFFHHPSRYNIFQCFCFNLSQFLMFFLTLSIRRDSRCHKVEHVILRKGFSPLVRTLKIFAANEMFLSRFTPTTSWWREIGWYFFIPAYVFFGSCTIQYSVGCRGYMKYLSKSCSFPVMPINPPLTFIFLCSCSMPWSGTIAVKGSDKRHCVL